MRPTADKAASSTWCLRDQPKKRPRPNHHARWDLSLDRQEAASVRWAFVQFWLFYIPAEEIMNSTDNVKLVWFDAWLRENNSICNRELGRENYRPGMATSIPSTGTPCFVFISRPQNAPPLDLPAVRPCGGGRLECFVLVNSLREMEEPKALRSTQIVCNHTRVQSTQYVNKYITNT